MKIPRRAFIHGAAVASGAVWLARGGSLLQGSPLGLAPGVQLWSVREQIKDNLDGTLHQLAAIGYREVELCASRPIPQREHTSGVPALNSASARVMPSSITLAPADLLAVALPSHDLRVSPLSEPEASCLGLIAGIWHILPQRQALPMPKSLPKNS